MNRRNTWLAVVVLAAASALAATGAFAATGNTQVDGIQTTVTLGDLEDPTDDVLRADGFSRQKNRYVRVLSAALLDGSLDLDAVALLDDDAVRTTLVALPGIGPWTAEVYVLSALRRPDTWPVGDIALQEAARRARRLDARPSPSELEVIGEAWRPHRASAARLLWHLYLSEPRRNGRPAVDP